MIQIHSLNTGTTYMYQIVYKTALKYIKDYIYRKRYIVKCFITVFINLSRFDEFGFRVEEEDGPEQNSKKLLGIPFVEDPQHRLINYIFFTYLM